MKYLALVPIVLCAAAAAAHWWTPDDPWHDLSGYPRFRYRINVEWNQSIPAIPAHTVVVVKGGFHDGVIVAEGTAEHPILIQGYPETWPKLGTVHIQGGYVILGRLQLDPRRITADGPVWLAGCLLLDQSLEPRADLNGDGVVDLDDFAILKGQFGRTAAQETYAP